MRNRNMKPVLSLLASVFPRTDLAMAQDDCPSGFVSVYRQEDSGLPDASWRKVYVFDTGLEPPNLSVVLHYDPTTQQAEWLDGHMSGTNISVFGLVPLKGDGATLPFRFADLLDEEAQQENVCPKRVTALIVDTAIYWPECMDAETVEGWKGLAGPVPK